MRRGPAAFLAALAVVVSAAVLWIPYLQGWGGPPFLRPDADIVFAYQALLLGDGRPQGDTAHHGYIYFLALSWWYRLAHVVGAVPAFRLSDLSAGLDVISAFADLIVVGRLLSLLLGIGFALVFALVLWRVTRDRLVTLVIGVAFALGEGLGFQTILLRTELLAVFLLVMAFAALLMAARANAVTVPFWLFLAGLLASLSYNSKLQVFFSLLALPVLALAFGAPRDPRDAGSAPGTSTRLAWAILLLFATPGWLAVFSRVGAMGPFSFVYVPAIVAYCVACIAVYGRIFGIPVRERYAAVFWIYGGFGIGLSLLFLHRHPAIFAIDANPLEHMSRFLLQAEIKAPAPDRLGSAVPAVVGAVLGRIGAEWAGGGPLDAAYRLSFWLSAGLTAALAALRLWKPVVQTTLLVGLASLLVGINGVRYGAATPAYSIFVDPWILLAIAVAAAALRKELLRRHGRAAVAAVLLLAAIAISQRNLEAGARDSAQPAANICAQAEGYLAPDIARAFRPLCR